MLRISLGIDQTFLGKLLLWGKVEVREAGGILKGREITLYWWPYNIFCFILSRKIINNQERIYVCSSLKD